MSPPQLTKAASINKLLRSTTFAVDVYESIDQDLSKKNMGSSDREKEGFFDFSELIKENIQAKPSYHEILLKRLKISTIGRRKLRDLPTRDYHSDYQPSSDESVDNADSSPLDSKMKGSPNRLTKIESQKEIGESNSESKAAAYQRNSVKITSMGKELSFNQTFHSR